MSRPSSRARTPAGGPPADARAAAAALVPSFILRRSARARGGRIRGAALFADISGFTALTEALAGSARTGAETLAEALRFYFDPLVAAVERAGGEVAGFAGDGVTAIFPPDTAPRPAAAARAAGGEIVSFFRAHPLHRTPAGEFPFAVRVGIGRGPLEWGVLRGGSGPDGFFFRGPALVRAVAAQGSAARNELAGAAAERGMARPAPRKRPAARGRGRDPRSFVAPEVLAFPQPGEFRVVTILFAGFPTATKPAALRAALDRAVGAFGGHCGRLDFGDKGAAALLFFGAPVALENDHARALDCARALVGAFPPRAAPRCGVTRDRLYIGRNGGTRRHEFTALGRGVNLAARLMTAAAGEILCDAAAAAGAGRGFEMRPLGARAFKGFGAPQPVFRLAGRATAPSAGSSGALIGREAELRELSGLLAPIFSGGFAGVIYVDGEAGMGKSSLAATVRDRIAETGGGRAIGWMQTACDPILRESLNPFVRMLRESAALRPGDPAGARKFARWFARLSAAAGSGDAAAGAGLRAMRPSCRSSPGSPRGGRLSRSLIPRSGTRVCCTRCGRGCGRNAPPARSCCWWRTAIGAMRTASGRWRSP